MALVMLEADELPDGPLYAAAHFHANVLPRAREVIRNGDDLLLSFPPGDKAQCGWRRAAIQSLAREAAPARVNGVAAQAGAPTEEVRRYLSAAPGVTGQLLDLAGNRGQKG